MDISIPTRILERVLQLSKISIFSNLDRYIVYWPLFVIGLVLSFILTPLLGKLAYKWGVTYRPRTKRRDREYDNPEKALHDKETPSLGGLAITIPLLFAILVFFRLDAFTIPIIISLFILVLGSILDDIFNLPSKVQLFFQIFASLIVAFSIIDLTHISFFSSDFINLTSLIWRFNLFSIPFSFVFPGDLILFLWILLCINSVKWVGGSPGLIESYSLVIFVLLFIIGVRTYSLFTSSLSVFISGGLLSLLFFAFPPPKIMSGSTGKSLYGFLISILALITGIKFSITIMLVALPVIDSMFVLINRYITYKPKNLLELMRINDTSHLHHKLLQLNLSSRQVLLIETTFALLIGSIAILSVGAFRYFALIFTLFLIIAFIAYINYRASKKESEERKSPESKYSY